MGIALSNCYERGESPRKKEEEKENLSIEKKKAKKYKK
jgi:hypothetical protein